MVGAAFSFSYCHRMSAIMLLRWDNMVDYSTANIDFLWHHFFQISRPITVKISSDMGQFQSDTDEPLLFAGLGGEEASGTCLCMIRSNQFPYALFILYLERQTWHNHIATRCDDSDILQSNVSLGINYFTSWHLTQVDNFSMAPQFYTRKLLSFVSGAFASLYFQRCLSPAVPLLNIFKDF